MIKVSAADAKTPIDLATWDLGDPVADVDGKFGDKMQRLASDLNGVIQKLQDLVLKVRISSKKP